MTISISNLSRSIALSGYSGISGSSGYSGYSGTSGTSGAAGPSTTINATDDTSSSTLYPVMVAANGSNQTAKVTTSKLTFDAANGNLGIGTSAPGALDPDARNLVVGGGSGNTGISIYSGNASGGRLMFADGTSGDGPYVGQIHYDHSSNYMRFISNGGERMRITSAGDVGIGGTPNNYGGQTCLTINNASGYVRMDFNIGGVKKSSIYGEGSSNMIFETAGSERMRIDSSGNVGIGTSSPGAKLDVRGVTYIGFVANTNAELKIGPGDGTKGKTGLVYYSATFGASWGGTDTAARTVFRAGASNTGGDAWGTMCFDIDSNQSDVPSWVNRFRLFGNSGYLYVGGVYDAVVGGTNRDVYVDNSGLIGYVSSVRASKTNINDITDVSWLHELNPVSFQYRKRDSDGNYTDETDGPVDFGLIAEDTEIVKPELCFYDIVNGQSELRGINYSKLIVPLVKAIQELKAEFDAYKATHP